MIVRDLEEAILNGDEDAIIDIARSAVRDNDRLRAELEEATSARFHSVEFRHPDGRTEIYDLTPAFKESKIRDELIRHGWSAPEEAKRLRASVRELEEEVDVLRRYGNKDCLAMADEALANSEKED